MRIKTFLLSLLFSIPLFGNMASPIQEGSTISTPFLSQEVDIVDELIRIVPGADFQSANFSIRYQIRVHKAGTQIPMLFVAPDYGEGFSISFAGKKVPLQVLPEQYWSAPDSFLSEFPHWGSKGAGPDEVGRIRWMKNQESTYQLEELLYFELDMLPGDYEVVIEYDAHRWENNLDWVAQKSFNYALSPAKFWKSFGKLRIELDGRNTKQPLSTNLGAPHSGSLDQIASWDFDELPAENIEITYSPQLNRTAKTLIGIGPTGLSRIAAVLFFLLNVWWLNRFRKKDVSTNFPAPLWLGMFLFPMVVIGAYVMTYTWISMSLGSDASNQMGYYILSWLLYPILLIVYGVLMYVLDRIFFKKRKV